MFKQKQAMVWNNLNRLFPRKYTVKPANIKRSDRGESLPVPGYYELSEDTFYYDLFNKKFEARQADWLFLHEGTPGHHFQMKAEQIGTECNSLTPEIFYAAYLEGWAAYAETLAEDLGLYDAPEAKLAAVEWDMVRSVRVVLDVAMNAYGWSDEKALAYWKENIRGQPDIAMREIARMNRWPAQVITYKYGANVFQSIKAAHLKTVNTKSLTINTTKEFHDAAIAFLAQCL